MPLGKIVILEGNTYAVLVRWPLTVPNEHRDAVVEHRSVIAVPKP